jgi:hypothetical protein
MSRLTHLLDRLNEWLVELERARNEAWLARSTDVFQLEARLRDLERHGN